MLRLAMMVNPPFRYFILALALLFVRTASGQIVNIERQRIVADTTGWLGHAGFSFAGSKNTKSIIALSLNTLIEYKSRNTKDLWLMIADIALISGEGEDFTNSGFGHLRYNRKLSDAIRWEVYTQLQYNSLVKIDRRILAGSGPRFKLTQYEHAKFYFGVAYMFEYQELLAPRLLERNHRLSSYFSFTLNPEEQVSFISTFYAQPLLTDFGDYLLSSESTLVLGITEKLNLSVSFRYLFDKVPPAEVPNSIYAFANTLEVKF